MATLAIAGKAGSVASVGTGDVGDEVTDWEATAEADLLDATSFDSLGFREFIEGLKKASGTLTAIGVAPVQGALTSLTLQTSTVVGSLQITGAAILNSVTVGTPVEDKVTYNAAFSYTGAFVVDTVPA